MNSQVNVLLHVARGLCKDVQAAYPALKGLSLDLDRLALYCQTRGLGVFSLDLPHLDSLLVQGLESGRLDLAGPLSKRVSARIRVPRFFSGLWLRVFDRDACLKSDVDITALFFLRQFLRLGKNIEVECSHQRIITAAKEYTDVERSLRSPTLRWDLDRLYYGEGPTNHHLGDGCFDSIADPEGSLQFHQETGEKKEEAFKARWLTRSILYKVQQVADLIIGSLEHYNPTLLSEAQESDSRGTGFKHGLGAVSERMKNWEKSQFQFWPDKLQHEYPFELVGKTAGSNQVRPSRHEGPSRLMCVPKTAKGPRLIASEPTAHMYCQQHLWGFLRESLYKSGISPGFIDFTDQGASSDLVLASSLDRKLATVDLSSASDRLSCWTVERIFRSSTSILSALHATRTRYIRDDVSDVKGFLKLKKFASQGTATTFPVQSIVFLCIALGCSIQGAVNWRSIRKLRNQVRVYGDDIIVPAHGYARLVSVMDALQLKVNLAKSFVNGQFRESCGTDGYKGCCITPVSPKTLVADGPASCQAVVDTTNNLHSKGLWHASQHLESTIPLRLRRGLRVVASNEAGFVGLTSLCGSDERHLKKRWNTRLHRYEVRVHRLVAVARSRDRQGYPALLDFFSKKYSYFNPRVVSEYRDIRRIRMDSAWEPVNYHALGHDREIQEWRRIFERHAYA